MSTAVRAEPAPLIGRPTGSSLLDFELPDALLAREPPEARGLARDEVRLMVSDADDDTIDIATARDLPRYLAAGDLLVVNASATIAAALDGWRPATGGEPDEMIAVHLSTPAPSSTPAPDGDADDRRWVIELRRLTPNGTRPLLDARAGERICLRGGATATLLAPYSASPAADGSVPPNGKARLWVAELACPAGVLAYAGEHGSPIRYAYVPERWPLSAYQTVFATEPGSAEMPSAARAFTPELVERLESKGIGVAPLVLHTGVASLEVDEPPYPERFRVPLETADAVMRTRARGSRVIAVGTTVVRALETVASPDGRVRAGAGWTSLVISRERGVRAVDGILTGLHEPRASHLAMLEAIAGRQHLAVAYEAALRERFLWHEFGDLHLIMRRAREVHAD